MISYGESILTHSLQPPVAIVFTDAFPSDQKYANEGLESKSVLGIRRASGIKFVNEL